MQIGFIQQCFDRIGDILSMKQWKEKVEQIQMPKDMQQRILNNCYEKMEEEFMEKTNSKINFRKFRKPIVAVAALGLCLCLAGGTAALAGGKQGFFHEIKRGGGRYNLVYEQATEEIKLEVSADANGVFAEVIFVDADRLPYRDLEAIGLRQYQILAEDGTVVLEKSKIYLHERIQDNAEDETVVLEGSKTEVAEIVDGKANILLAREQLPSGTYTLVVTQLIAEKKADQPLVIIGEWESTFVLE